MGSIGQVISGAVGGIVGFFTGGPAGAIAGFSLGYSIGGLFFGPDIPDDTKPNDDFNVTGATEGSPMTFVMGRREVQGNVIYFGDVDIVEITEEPGKGGGGGEYVVETRPFAPVHLTLCVDTLEALNGVYDGKRRDWIALNDSVGGNPLLISTGAGTDFAYAPEASPMPGVTSLFSSRLFLGENARSMTPLIFDISVLPTDVLGDPEADLSTGVNPASVYYTILTNKQYGRGLDPALLNLSSFFDAYDIFKAEDRGINVLIEGSSASFKQVMRQLNFHTDSLIRVDTQGRLELYPLRWGNWTAVPVAEIECKDVQVTVKSWAFVDNDFIATYPSADHRFTQRTVRQKNEAVQSAVGTIQTRSYNFPWFTDAENVTRRLSELMEAHSYPGPVLSLKLSKKFHLLRPGDVIALTHSAYDFDGSPNNGYFRVLDMQDADFAKTGVSIKAKYIRENFSVTYTPPIPLPNPPVADVEPGTIIDAFAYQDKWGHPRSDTPIGPPGPVPVPGGGGGGPGPGGGGFPVGGGGGPPGSPTWLIPLTLEGDFYGYPLKLWAARGSGRDLVGLFEVVHAQLLDLPIATSGRTPSTRWAYAFSSLTTVPARHHFRSDEPFQLTFRRYPNQVGPSFGHDAVDANGFYDAMETGRFALLIGNTELCLFEQLVPVSGDTFHIYGLCRGVNKEYLYRWPIGTPVALVDTRPHDLPNGMRQSNWAFRQRNLRLADYDDPAYDARVRTFVQAVDLNGVVQAPDEGLGGDAGKTWQSRAGAKESACSLYAPANEILANRAPMPTCQAYKKGSGDLSGEARSWYAEASALASVNDWVVEFPPFPDDFSGIGDRVAFDEVDNGGVFGPPETYWERSYGATDASFDSFVGANAAVNGQTYRLFILDKPDDDPLIDSALRTLDITFSGSEETWPAFLYTGALQTSDGVASSGNSLVFWVAVQGLNGHFCRPRLVDKIGNDWGPQEDPAYLIFPS